jgi:hypothetical protein
MARKVEGGEEGGLGGGHVAVQPQNQLAIKEVELRLVPARPSHVA